LGGWLSLFNMAFWVGVFLLLHSTRDARGIQHMEGLEWLEGPIMTLVLFMSLPFAAVCLGPGLGSGGDPMNEAIRMAIVIGLNAFAWGYGLALLIGGVKKWIAVFRPRGSSTRAARHA
jgi:hypothetical protein